jgi:hypothetical protein
MEYDNNHFIIASRAYSLTINAECELYFIFSPWSSIFSQNFNFLTRKNILKEKGKKKYPQQTCTYMVSLLHGMQYTIDIIGG